MTKQDKEKLQKALQTMSDLGVEALVKGHVKVTFSNSMLQYILWLMRTSALLPLRD